MRLLVLLLTVACGRPDAPARPSVSASDALQTRRSVYEAIIPTVQDADGFVDTDHCDALLHTALLGAGGVPIRIEAARNDNGQWFRRPISLPECLSAKASKSTISRDMLLGVMWYGWHERDANMLQSLWDYGVAHNWRMGDHDGSMDGLSRVYLTPNLQSTLARMLHKLSAKDYGVRHLPNNWSGGSLLGFEAHLEVLHALLEQQVGGETTSMRATLVGYAARDQSNPLTQFGLGNTDLAAQLLLAQHPADRLPTSADHCGPLRYERQWASQPVETCPERDRTHAGIHFMFLSKLILDVAGKHLTINQ